MKNILIFAIMLAIVPATSVVASAPPGGWGTDCSNWQHYYTPVTTNHLIYDPVAGFYRDCVTGDEVVWPEFQFDLWIEMEIIVHFDWTEAEIHRASLYDDIELVIPGWIEQNSGNWVIVMPSGSDPNSRPYTLDYMNFIEDIFGRTTMPDYGRDIPVSWYYSLVGASGPWHQMTPSGPNYQFLIENVSHTDFWYLVVIDVELHENDGFYKMHGDICPLPTL